LDTLRLPRGAESRKIESTPAAAPVATSTANDRPAPGWLEAIAWAILFAVVGQLLPFFLVDIGMRAFGVGPEMFGALLLPTLLAGQVLGVGLTILALRDRLGKAWKSAIHLRRPALVPCLLAVLCLPAFLLASGSATLLVQQLVQQGEPSARIIATGSAQNGFLFVVLVVAIGASLNEELFCRGFLGHGLVGRYGVLVGILLTSVIFGVLHGNIVQGFFAFLLGCFVHLCYLATRSLWVPILLHFLNNSWAVVVRTLVPDAESMDFEVWGMIAYAAVVFAIAIPSVWGLYRYYKHYKREAGQAAAMEASLAEPKIETSVATSIVAEAQAA
jgi:membrane protease YdiL (CAAX protease family)